MIDEDMSPEHLTWLTKSRFENQTASAKLYTLLKKHPDKVASDYARVVEALVAIAFSLWRSAFLADKSDQKHASLKDAEVFLGKMLLDNAINYPQDRRSREWTFDYYIYTALQRLNDLQKMWPDILEVVKPGNDPKTLTSKQTWEYLQNIFFRAVERLEKSLASA